jgi:membrane protease YdiL (CAAX protease family)
VPGEFWTDLANLLISTAFVAAPGLLVGVFAWRIVKRDRKQLFLPPQPYRVPWTGFEVLVSFLIVFILIPEIIASAIAQTGAIPNASIQSSKSGDLSEAQKRAAEIASIVVTLWARVLALPLQLTIFLVACRVLYPQVWFKTRPSLSAQIFVAIVAWAVLTVLVHSTNILANIILKGLDSQREAHPLEKLGGQPFLESVLFLIQACVATPIVEELIFRGVILGWAIGGRKPIPIPDVPDRIRPWLIMLAALAFASLSVNGLVPVYSGRQGAPIFVLLLMVGLAAIQFWFKGKRRILSGVYSSAALFAAVHSSIWPSPIPLFLLGLGLGWLVVRTRSILVPIIVHGLFNAISTVAVLRGP